MQPTPHNGILGAVPSDYIARAVAQCLDPATETSDEHVVALDVPSIGRVSILCARRRDARWRRYLWAASRADLRDVVSRAIARRNTCFPRKRCRWRCCGT